MINIIVIIVVLFFLYYIIKSAVKDGIKEAHHELYGDNCKHETSFKAENTNE